jgi:Tfp pilus assembly protein PilF
VGLKKFPEDVKSCSISRVLSTTNCGERERALANMESILKSNPSNAHALNFVGYTYGEMGKDLDKAEQYVRKALELRPNDGFIEDSLGWVLFKKGKTAEALEHLARANDPATRRSGYLRTLGRYLF